MAMESMYEKAMGLFDCRETQDTFVFGCVPPVATL
jgi:hypothetical protein